MKRYNTDQKMDGWVWTVPEPVWERLTIHQQEMLMTIGEKVDAFKEDGFISN